MTARVIIKDVKRQLRRQVPLPGGRGITTVNAGVELGQIEVIVDLAQIARELGPRAMSNRSGFSKYLGGAVQVSVLNSKRITQEEYEAQEPTAV